MLPQGYRKVIGMAEEVESTSTEAEE